MLNHLRSDLTSSSCARLDKLKELCTVIDMISEPSIFRTERNIDLNLYSLVRGR